MEMPQATASRAGLSTMAKGVIGTALFALVAVVLLTFWMFKGAAGSDLQDQSSAEGIEEGAPIPVTVVQPQPGGLDRTTTQPGTVRAFQYERIFPMVSGYLINQKVDIGSRVKKGTLPMAGAYLVGLMGAPLGEGPVLAAAGLFPGGATPGELLAEISAPQLLKEEQQAAASLEQAKAQVAQMEAHLTAARANLTTAKILINQRKAEVKRALSVLTYRNAMYNRIKQLADLKGVEQKLVDEAFEQFEAAEAGKDAAKAGIETAIADLEAKKADIAKAQADLSAARASVRVTEAALEKTSVFVGFTKIRSTYDGVITQRNYHDGDYIRAGNETGLPLLVVKRTDLMRVIVQIPDVNVPFCNVGDPVDLSISALPYVRFPGLKVSRKADSEDELSRTMRVEVDVANVDGPLTDGMYGAVTIHLQKGPATALRVPSTALRHGDGVVVAFVVRQGKAHQVPVQVGLNNGRQAEILAGLHADDLVIAQPGNLIQDGIDVKPFRENPTPAP